MPLGSRELYLIVRARDEASRTLRTIGNNINNLSDQQKALMNQKFVKGQMLTGMGTALVGLGAVGVVAFGGMTKAAMDFEKQASLTLTQVRDGGKTTLEDIKNISKRVAKEIPVPFEELQAGLFDIFSSTDLNAKQAEKALGLIAKAAVAGATTVQVAGDATISILNGFARPASELNKILDFQFKLVQVGKGTYEQFATSIGRAIPSANAAGQSYEDLGGALAFLTRNGMSTEMAATSAARAFDSLANPKVISRMEAMGITVKDAGGEMRPVTEIIEQLSNKFGDLTGPERIAGLRDLLKGAGDTAQARRFFIQAIENTDHFVALTEQVKGSAGAMGEAYALMSETGAAKFQAFKNSMYILGTTIGDIVLPYVIKFVDAMTGLVHWFDSIPAPMQKVILAVAAIGTAAALIVGPILILVGMFVTLSAAIAAGGGLMAALAGVASVIGVVMLAIVALAAVGFLVWKNWDEIKEAADRVWPHIKKVIQDVVEFLRPLVIDAFNAIKENALDVWGALGPFITKVWRDIRGGVEAAIEFLRPYIPAFIEGMKAVVSAGFAVVKATFSSLAWVIINVLVPGLNLLWEVFKIALAGIGAVVVVAWRIMQPIFQALIWVVKEAIIPAIETLATIFTTVFNIVSKAVEIAWAVVGPIFGHLFHFISNVIVPAIVLLGSIVGTVFGVIATVIGVAWEIIKVIFQAWWNVMEAVLRPAVKGLQVLFEESFGKIWGYIKIAWDFMKPVFEAIADWLGPKIGGALETLKNAWGNFWDGMGDRVSGGWEKARGIIEGVVTWVTDRIETVINNVIKAVNTAIDAYNKLPGVDNVKALGSVNLNPTNYGTTPTRTLSGGIRASHSGGLVQHMIGEFGRDRLRSDEVLRVLQTGEGVLQRSAMQKIGVSEFNALNRGESRSSGVNIAPGAVQITVTGSIDENMIPVVQREIETTMRTLFNELRSN